MDDFEKELKEGFLEDSETLLEQAEQALLDLENCGEDHTEVVNKLFRAAHNLKGTSRAVGFGQLAEFTHEMENLILKIKNNEMPITPIVVTVLLESFDQIGVMVQGLKSDLNATFDCTAHLERITSPISGVIEETSLLESHQEDCAGFAEEDSFAEDSFRNEVFDEGAFSEETGAEIIQETTSQDDLLTDESDEVSISGTLETEESSEKNQEEISLVSIDEVASEEGQPSQSEVHDLDLSNLDNIESENFSAETGKMVGADGLEEITQQPTPPPPLDDTSSPERPAQAVPPLKPKIESPIALDSPGTVSEKFLMEESFKDAESKASKKQAGSEPLSPAHQPVVKLAVEPSQELTPIKKITPPPSTAPPSAPGGGGKKQASAKNVDESIRVRLSSLEVLNNFVGELVILQSVLTQHQHEVTSPLMLKSLSQLGKLSKEIHQISMSLRMLPIKPTLQKMQRIVRDTSRSLSKKVNLVTFGDETEVDKTVLEHLNDPLTHIVRNAVDHGMETVEERATFGKPETGTVKLSCYHEGNNLVIEIIDDGKGIDPKVIKQKAIEKGVIGPESSLTDSELVNLIFHPGFTTKAEVSEVSGRGVGMDVARTNIQNLNGEISVASTVGKGSIFKISIPLTMAVIDGMVTQVGQEKYVFPLSQIQETLKPIDADISHITGLGAVLNLRGENLPLYQVSEILNRPKPKQSLALVEQIAVIVRSGNQPYALMVDQIHHQQQIVIKSLGAEIQAQKGFMGTSILGDGLPAFILDLNDLISKNQTKRKQKPFKGAG